MTISTVEPAYVAGDATSSRSGVTWSAVFAGAAVAGAVTLVLFVLGSAFGLSSVSPWPYRGATAEAVGIGAGLWLVLTQWLSAAMGGYITGRMRVKWASVHTHEVLFRDTAHGFLTWSVATLGLVCVLSLISMFAAGLGTTAVTGVASGAAQGAARNATAENTVPGLGTPSGYFTDMLFRPAAPAAGGAGAAPAGGGAAAAPAGTAPAAGNPPAGGATGTAAATPPGTAMTPPTGMDNRETRAEASRILLRNVGSDMSQEDKAYLAQLVSQRTGMSQDEAMRRVDAVNAQIKSASDKAKEAADKARKAAATASFIGFVALLIGAFIACAAAAFGGNQRDEFEAVYLQER